MATTSRPDLEAVHAHSAEHATSSSMTLTTETRTNVALYERFG